MSQQIRKTTKQDNINFIDIIMFYKIRKSTIFKVLSIFVYCFIEKYVCVDYLSLQIEPKLSLLHRKFEDTSFDKLSGIYIPEILLNIGS